MSMWSITEMRIGRVNLALIDFLLPKIFVPVINCWSLLCSKVVGVSESGDKLDDPSVGH